MHKLDDMVMFVEVVKAGSFRAAGERLGIPCSTISRHIAKLEHDIGLRLLHRTTRNLNLTDAGNFYYDRCIHIIEEARKARAQLEDLSREPSGLLRISLPVEFAISYFVPLLATFIERYPDIQFDFDLTSRRVNFVDDSHDVAIRMGALSDSSLIARQLVILPRFLYASPAFLSRYGRLDHPSQLAPDACIRMNTQQDRNGWILSRNGEDVKVHTGGRYSVNSLSMQTCLAVANHGIALLPESLAKAHVSSGELVQLLHEWQAPPIPIFAITESRTLPSRVTCLIEYLQSAMRESDNSNTL